MFQPFESFLIGLILGLLIGDLLLIGYLEYRRHRAGGKRWSRRD